MALPDGICHICGDFGPLSFEHVPPKKAFNRNPVFQKNVMEIWEHGRDNVRGWKQRRGAGAYTLCEPCNKKTGAWYADDFGDWCIGAHGILTQARGKSGYILCTADFHPLRVLKQIITMFFSVNPTRFADEHPELVRFVLNRKQMYLNPRYHISAYLAPEKGTRHMPLVHEADIYDGRFSYFSEIAFYPLGYVLTVDSPVWDSRLFDVSHFARYEYSDRRQLPMAMPLLPTHLPIPGDYRTWDEIERQAQDDAA